MHVDEGTALLRHSKRQVTIGWLLIVVVLLSFWHWHRHQKRLVGVSPFSAFSSSSSSSPIATVSSSSSSSSFSYEIINFNGWADSWLVYNEEVELVVVPSISRIMQFRFRGEDSVDSNPLWTQDSLAGKPADTQRDTWLNFGGDKAWPGPQKEWGNTLSRRRWPPPPVFDSAPFKDVYVHNETLVLVSYVDAWTGLQCVRKISLSGPSMTIKTELIQVAASISGQINNVSVWVVTQLKDPERVYVVSQPGRGKSFSVLADIGPQQATGSPCTLRESVVSCDGKAVTLVSMKRDPLASHKIGSDKASTLLWAGKEVILRIDSPLHGGGYPDDGCHAELWNNPDPLAYVELEFLGTFVQPTRGVNGKEPHNTLSSVYTLYHRDPKAKNIDNEVVDLLHCKYT